MKDNDPLVTINILSFNRKKDLQYSLLKIYEQEYKNIEIIVVDNASTDGTKEMIKTEFPDIILIELSNNIGISAWNKGFEQAKGEYVLVLDDDSYPDTLSIRKGIEQFQVNDTIGIVAYQILNLRYNIFETVGFEKKTLMFVGCGALINKRIITDIGGFNELIFIYYHELEYSARVYNLGYKIKFLEHVLIFHNQSSISRKESKSNPFRTGYRYYHYFISYSIYLITLFNFKYTTIYLLKWILNRLIVAVVYCYPLKFFKGIYYLILNFRKIYRQRQVLKLEVQKFYNFGNSPLLDRLYFKLPKKG